MLYLRHPALLWLKKNDTKKLPESNEAIQAIFSSGHKFETYAEALFEDGLRLGFNNQDEYKSLIDRTRQALDSGMSTIFQSRFVWGMYNCLPDIIKSVDGSQIDLYEIKSSTRVKKEHLYDLAFQREVIEANGLSIRQIFVVYVNKDYVRSGKISSENLTKIEDVTEAVNDLKTFTEEHMPRALEAMQATIMPDPDPSYLGILGNKTEWKFIYEHITNANKPDHIGAKASFNQLELKRFLSQLDYPLYFLDYETMSAAVPYFDGHRPYQQIPSQYSLHILESPHAELRQVEYLHRDNSDPSLPLTEHLLKDIGLKGSIITWNASFEKSCNTTLGNLNPEFADALQAVNDRVIDLMIPFKPSNGWYSDPRFEGSASIKKVLPVVVPSLSYKDLGIQNGGNAQALWMQAVLDEDRDDKEDILDDLLKYCRLDTLAMVEIYNVLTNITNS